MIPDSAVGKVELELTTICNAKCPLCPRNLPCFSSLTGNPMKRDVQEILNQLSRFPNLKKVHLVGQISEPTLHPEFLELAERLKDRGYSIFISTNGSTHRNDSFWHSLSEILTTDDSVLFVVCGNTQELHETYRVNTSLDSILKAARNFRMKGIDIGGVIRFRYNADVVDSREFDSFMERNFSRVFKINNDFSVPDRLESVFAPVKRVSDAMKRIDFESAFSFMTNEIICEMPMNGSVFIDIHGNVWPCASFYQESVERGLESPVSAEKSMDCCRRCTSPLRKIADRFDIGGWDGV